MFLFLILAYGSGALDAYVKGYNIYVESRDGQLMVSDAWSEEVDPDDLLRHSWREEENRKFRLLYGCQGTKKQRRQRVYDLD